MSAILNANFIKVLEKAKDCIVVKRGILHHVRQYAKDVKGGMPRYRAEYGALYADLPTELPELFVNLDGYETATRG